MKSNTWLISKRSREIILQSHPTESFHVRFAKSKPTSGISYNSLITAPDTDLDVDLDTTLVFRPDAFQITFRDTL